MDYFNFFRQFAPLSEDSYQALFASFQEKQAEKGSILLKEGAIQKEMLLVLEGVQMSYYYHHEKMQVLAFTYAPSPSGIPDSFLTQSPSRSCLQAMTDSRFYTISYSDLQNLLNQYRELEQLMHKLTESVLIGTIQRCVELQAFSMEERFRAFALRSPQLFQLIPHKYLASYLNISPTNFSKLYNRIRIG